MEVWYPFIILVGEIGHLNIINVVLYCSSSEVQQKKNYSALLLIVSSDQLCFEIESYLLDNPLFQFNIMSTKYRDLLALGSKQPVILVYKQTKM